MHIKIFRCIIFFVAFLLVDCESNTQNSSGYFRVERVVDGDTFWVLSPTSKKIKVRLIGVDAPESKKVFKKAQGVYGKEAKEYVQTMLKGKRVKLIKDIDSLDQYGRTLSYVYLEDGTFVNAELIRNGYANLMTIPPNIRFADQFVQLQEEARINKRGLWAAPNF